MLVVVRMKIIDIKVPGPAAQNVLATRQSAASHRTSRLSSPRPVSPRHQLRGLRVVFEVSMEDSLAVRVDALGSPGSSHFLIPQLRFPGAHPLQMSVLQGPHCV